MDVVRFADAERYEPGGHHGVVNRLLAGLGQGAVPEVSVWHGTIDPGGGADLHTHDGSVQIYALITGNATVSGGGRAEVLGPGDVAIIPAGEAHDIHNRADLPVTVLVISAPALR